MNNFEHTSSNDLPGLPLRRNAKSFFGFICVLGAVAVIGTAARAEGSATGSSSPTNAVAEVATDQPEAAWSFTASAYLYILPDSREYVQPSFSADRDWLHLEARYNYEDLETGSAWVGYNFGSGEKLAWELTPMLGGVFGDTTGMAPGYKGSLSWWKLELYSEGEYVWDVGNSSDSFFYNWSELSLSPVDWFRLGLVTQRTRAYESDREVQRGLLIGCSYKAIDFTAYVFNPDDDKPILTFACGVQF